MRTKHEAPIRRGVRRRHPDSATGATVKRPADASQSRRSGKRGATASPPHRTGGATRPGPRTAVTSRPEARPKPPKNTKQAKARARARKAKAPKVVRTPLRIRLINRLASVDLRPRTLAAKVPFVVLIIGSLGVGLGLTLWLSTDAAERSYQLGNIRAENRVLLQQKEALERDVLQAQSAPALAEAARNLGMIPSTDTAHLVQDPTGNWVVVGNPKPADGVPTPPLNTKLPDEQSVASAQQPAPQMPKQSVEVPVRLPSGAGVAPVIPGRPELGGEVPQLIPDAVPLSEGERSASAPVEPAVEPPMTAAPAGIPPADPPMPAGASTEQFSAPNLPPAPDDLR